MQTDMFKSYGKVFSCSFRETTQHGVCFAYARLILYA